MEISQMRYLVALSKTRSFSKAAASCGVSQPALSEQIQKLELEMGKTLFDRNRRNAVPSNAGRTLIEKAERILKQIDAIREDVRGSDGTVAGKVNIGILPTIAPYFLPYVLAHTDEAARDTRLNVHEDTKDRLLEMTDSGELDLSILSLPVKKNGFETELLFTEELLLALPFTHPLARKKEINEPDLYGEKFILMRECHCLGDRSLKFCQKHDFRSQIAFRSSQIETILSLVMLGAGISLIPSMAKASSRIPLVYRSLKSPKPIRQIVVLWRSKRDRSWATDAFLKHLRRVTKAYIQAAKDSEQLWEYYRSSEQSVSRSAMKNERALLSEKTSKK